MLWSKGCISLVHLIIFYLNITRISKRDGFTLPIIFADKRTVDRRVIFFQELISAGISESALWSKYCKRSVFNSEVIFKEAFYFCCHAERKDRSQCFKLAVSNDSSLMLWLLINGIARVFFLVCLSSKYPILVVVGIETVIKIRKPPKTLMTQCGPIVKETSKNRIILTKLWRRLRKSSSEPGMIQKTHVLNMDQENWVL